MVKEKPIFMVINHLKFILVNCSISIRIFISYFQSNVEGELINELQGIGFEYDGIIFNPGGYTHTSVAIGDAIAAIKTPVIEVHISNVHAREDFRKLSYVSGKSTGSIFGLGLKGYEFENFLMFQENQQEVFLAWD